MNTKYYNLYHESQPGMKTFQFCRGSGHLTAFQEIWELEGKHVFI